ncbi:hypothetical protein HK100_004215, partial [Physocladia obscura]
KNNSKPISKSTKASASANLAVEKSSKSLKLAVPPVAELQQSTSFSSSADSFDPFVNTLLTSHEKFHKTSRDLSDGDGNFSDKNSVIEHVLIEYGKDDDDDNDEANRTLVAHYSKESDDDVFEVLKDSHNIQSRNRITKKVQRENYKSIFDEKDVNDESYHGSSDNDKFNQEEKQNISGSKKTLTKRKKIELCDTSLEGNNSSLDSELKVQVLKKRDKQTLPAVSKNLSMNSKPPATRKSKSVATKASKTPFNEIDSEEREVDKQPTKGKAENNQTSYIEQLEKKIELTANFLNDLNAEKTTFSKFCTEQKKMGSMLLKSVQDFEESTIGRRDLFREFHQKMEADIKKHKVQAEATVDRMTEMGRSIQKSISQQVAQDYGMSRIKAQMQQIFDD